MKAVRIANTVKYIEKGDSNITLFRIQEILSEYRAFLITGILSDLRTYVQFKFYVKVDKEVEGYLTEKLLDLSNSKVDLDRYTEIVNEIEITDTYRVPSQLFFQEIDALLETTINPPQLKLVR